MHLEKLVNKVWLEDCRQNNLKWEGWKPEKVLDPIVGVAHICDRVNNGEHCHTSGQEKKEWANHGCQFWIFENILDTERETKEVNCKEPNCDNKLYGLAKVQTRHVVEVDHEGH